MSALDNALKFIRSKEVGDEKLLIHRPRLSELRPEMNVPDVKPMSATGSDS